MLSVVIPAYNEAHRLGPSLAAVVEFLRGQGTAWEVIVVDDGSTDDTVGIVDRFAQNHEGVRLLKLPHNRGKGAAVRAGMLAADGALILFCDADLATPMEELSKLQHAIDDGADIAIASRGAHGAVVARHQSWLRESIGKLFNVVVRATGAGPYRDTQCGFKLFRRDAARTLFAESRVDGFAFDVEVLMLARGRYSVAEIPVHGWQHVEETKVSRLAGARAFADVVGLSLARRWPPWGRNRRD